MTEKAELISIISEILGIKLASMERMTKEDLERLQKHLTEPGTLIQITQTGIRGLRGKAREELTKPLREFLDRPLIDLLESLGGRAEGERRILGNWYPGKLFRDTLQQVGGLHSKDDSGKE